MEKYNLDVSKWIRKDGRRKEVWAKSYTSSSTKLLELYKEGAGIPPYEPFFIQTDITTDRLIEIVSTVYEYGLEGYKEFGKMKSAWSQYNYRQSLKSKKKQTFNFVLSKDVKPALKQLSETRGLPINHIVEEAIMGLLDPTTQEGSYPTPQTQELTSVQTADSNEVKTGARPTLEEQLESLLEEREQLTTSLDTELNSGGALRRANRSGWLGARNQQSIVNIEIQIDEIHRKIKQEKQSTRTATLKRGKSGLTPLRQNRQKNKGSEVIQRLLI